MKSVCSIKLWIVIAAVLTILLPVNALTSKEKNKEKSPTLVLENADENETSMQNGEVISILRGNVRFKYEDMVITSREATMARKQGSIQFTGGVLVRQEHQHFSCDRMDYSKETNQLIANGHFNYYDSLQQARLTGSNGDYHFGKKVFTLRGAPKLTKIDTAAAETLIIIGKEMFYYDSLKKATVLQDVRITKGPLSSDCGQADFYTKLNSASLRTTPRVRYEANTVHGDSIDLQFGKESLKKAVVMGHSYGEYVDTSGGSKVRRDTMVTHIWSDSLCMMVSDSGNLDSLWAHGKVNAEYYASTDKLSKNKAFGKKMLMSFAQTGNLDLLKIWGNARSIYFIEEQDGSGKNEATGDSITVGFNERGKATRLNLSGSARGTYYPQLLVTRK